MPTISFSPTRISASHLVPRCCSAPATLIAVPLGAGLAFLMVRTDIPGGPWLEPLILLLIFLPAVVLAFGYVAALGPVGILTTAFKEWTGVVPWNVFIPLSGRDCRTHSCAACVSLRCGGFARS